MRKVEKESRRNLDQEIRVLRKENEDLRRTVARLRKALEKQGVHDTESDEPQPMKQLEEAPITHIACGSCGSAETKIIHIPSGRMLVCTKCLHRRKV